MIGCGRREGGVERHVQDDNEKRSEEASESDERNISRHAKLGVMEENRVPQIREVIQIDQIKVREFTVTKCIGSTGCGAESGKRRSQRCFPPSRNRRSS